MIRDGVLLTPPVTDDILEGITRAGIMEICDELGLRVVERSIDRSEIYVADEAFFCGTGAQISPIIEVDRRAIGGGAVGPITRRIKDRYFDIVRGNVPAYAPLGDAGPRSLTGAAPAPAGRRRRVRGADGFGVRPCPGRPRCPRPPWRPSAASP